MGALCPQEPQTSTNSQRRTPEAVAKIDSDRSKAARAQL